MSSKALGWKLTPHIYKDEIAWGVARLAREISEDYSAKNPLLIGILKGSFIFMADLVRELDIPVSIDCIRANSYSGAESTGEVSVSLPGGVDVRGRHVVLIEDIVDTGITVARLLEHFEESGPASIKLCALLDKPSRRVTPVKVDYLGFEVPDRFVVGYGMDLDQQWRHLSDICFVEKPADGESRE